MSGQKDPSEDRPDWLEIRFPCPRTINRIVALCFLPAVNSSPRDFEFQVDVKDRWRTVGSGRGEWAWVLHREFPPVTTSRTRMVVTKINDGWHGDRRWMHVLMGPKATNYTASKLLVSELEAYGPEPPVELKASVKSTTKAEVFARETVTITVRSRSDKAHKAKAKMTAPPGWKLEPMELAFDLAGGGAAKVGTFDLVAPPEIPVGPIPVRIALVDRDGQTLDYTVLSLAVASPVEIAPQLPKTLDETQQPMSAAIRNLTDQPLNGVARLDLAGITAAGPVTKPPQLEQPFGPIPPRQAATLTFNVAGMKLVGPAWRATYSVRANGLLASAQQELALRGWQVLGPFPNDGGTGFDRAYEPESRIDLGRAYAPPGGQAALRWKPVMSDASGFIDLFHQFQPNSNVCAYAVVYVKSPTARKALLSAGSDDGVKAWINGKLVLSNNATRGASPAQDQVPVGLNAGPNEVLLKITQGSGGWGFYFDLLTPDGQPMPDIIHSQRRE
jgi:hypothetical protein